MKILFIINSLKNKSGTERVACNLANLFTSELGYDVTILNRETSKSNAAYELSDQVTVEKLCGSIFSFYTQIQKYLNKNKPDFLVVHNMGKLTLLASFLNLRSTKLVSLEHVAFISRPKWVQKLSNLCYGKVENVVVLTENDINAYKTMSNKVIKINNISPYPIDKNKTYNDKSNEIIAIGRLTYQKNFEALLESWSLLRENMQDWHLKIYGVGENLLELEQMIVNQRLNNVSLMGESSEMQKVYENASFFVMSSRFEGLPMVLIEAQIFGLPIISFDCPHGPSEVIHHNIDGILVEDQNIEKLAYSINDLILNVEKRRSFSMAAKNNAERFTKNYILNQWKQLFGSKKI